MRRAWSKLSQYTWGSALFFFTINGIGADEPLTVQKQLIELQRQNELLQKQIVKQQQLIDNLGQKVSEIQTQAARQEAPASKSAQVNDEPSTPLRIGNFFSPGKLHVSAEGGLALFHSESAGPYPNAEFRVDEARLFIEAPVWKDVYVFSELNIITREDPDFHVQLGELYV